MLMEMTSYFKCTEEGKKDMSETFRKIYESGIEEAMKKGSDERAEDNARCMIMDGSLSLSKVAKFSGLSLDEVEKLKRSIDI